MTDWAKIRAEFPSLAKWTFLNTATFGQSPRCAAEAVARHMARRVETACMDFLEWYEDMDRIRAACAKLVNCAPEDIAFIPSSSIGLSFLMQGLDWRPGDEVLTIEHEFPNQLYLSAAVDRFGARHKVVAWPDFEAALTERTRVVVLSTVNYATGFRPPLEELGPFLAERGIALYVDGTQSIGALAFDTQRVRPAILCVDAYKWLLSPNGAGFVYIAPDLRRMLPPTIIGWRTDRNWREVNTLNHGRPVLSEDAEKYEGGGLPFPPLYAMGAALRILLAIGMPAIETRVLDLAAQTRALLRDFGADVNTDASQIVSACLPGRDSAELARKLKEQRILVSARHGRLRVSPHFYNNEEDLEVLRQGIMRCQ